MKRDMLKEEEREKVNRGLEDEDGRKEWYP